MCPELFPWLTFTYSRRQKGFDDMCVHTWASIPRKQIQGTVQPSEIAEWEPIQQSLAV